MATYKYLDKTGLGQVWDKVKGKDKEVLAEIGQRLGESTNSMWWHTFENGYRLQDFMNNDNPSIIAYHNQETIIFLYRHDYNDATFSFNYYSLDGKALLTYNELGSVWQLIVDNTVIEEIGYSTISDFSFYVPKGEWISEGLSEYLIADAEWHDVTTFLSEIESEDIFDILNNYNVIAFIRNIESDGYYNSFTLFNVDREYYYFSSLDNVVQMSYNSSSNKWEYSNNYMPIEYIDDWSEFGVYIKPSPHPNWEESDSTSLDYIKNKPPVHPGTGVNSLIIGATSNQVTGDASIANGINNNVSGHYSIVNGDSNLASQGVYEIINGYDNTTSGYFAVANGQYNKASEAYSLAHGNYSEASATHAIAIGSRAKASGNYSLAFGGYSKIGSCALTGDASATTYSTILPNQSSVDYMKHYGVSSYVNDANKNLIRVTKVVDGAAEFEVLITFESTLSDTALSEVMYTFYATPIATGVGAISMGICNTASGKGAVALGSDNVSSGFCSFAEGKWTTASGEASHSENKSTIASGKYTHAQGEYTQANGYAETAIGRYNTLSNANAQTAYNTTNSPYILVAGNGTADNARSNAHTLDWSGNGWYAGKLTVGANPTADMDVATKKYVDDNVEAIPQPEDDINVLNLLTEFGYSAPVADADNKIITDADNNIVLG